MRRDRAFSTLLGREREGGREERFTSRPSVLRGARQVHELGTRGVRSLAVGRKDGEEGPWRMLGILTFLDPPRPDTKQARCVRAMALRLFCKVGRCLVPSAWCAP